VAAEIFANNHPNEVFYFPSYEAVMFGTASPWEVDMRHVSSEAVERVMHLFSEMFLNPPKNDGFLSFTPMQEIKKTPLIRLKNMLRPLKGIL
jgi:GSCFA family